MKALLFLVVTVAVAVGGALLLTAALTGNWWAWLVLVALIVSIVALGPFRAAADADRATACWTNEAEGD